MEYKITNPLDQKETIGKIIDCFCNDYNFYNALTHCMANKKISGNYSIHYRDQLEVFIFNKWKRVMLHYADLATPDLPTYHQLKILGEYLKDKNPKDYSEVAEIMDYESIKDNDLKKALNTFRWNQLGEYSSWNHIDSSYVLFGSHKREKIEHRLYINCDSNYTHQIIYEFMKKCHERHIRYYFKYDIYGDRDDTIVFYSDTKHVPIYADILNEIKKEHRLDSHLHEPPLLAGRIDGWIGYGSEPLDENGRSVYSFNSKREKHLKRCIYEETYRWVKANLNNEYQYKNRKVDYETYIISRMIDYKKGYLLNYITDSDKQRQVFGYGKKDIESPNFDYVIYQGLRQNFDKILENSKNPDSDFQLDVPFQNGKITFGMKDINQMVKEQTSFMNKASSKYQEALKNRIQRTANDYEISSNNYAFDISKEELLKGVKNVEVASSIQADGSYRFVPNKKTSFIYTPMTDKEVEESRRKLGF